MDARMRQHWAMAVTIIAAIVLAMGAASAVAKPSIQALSTGVGAEERYAHPEYSVLLTFADASGPYLASIGVQIKDARGDVIYADSAAGPWLFAKLPPGNYTVMATRPNGKETGAVFSVDGGRQETVHLTW